MSHLPRIAQDFNPRASIVVHCGNALDFLKTLPSSRFRLIVTSPPYNIGKPYENALPMQEYLAAQEEVVAELVRCLADDGSVCWQVGNYVDAGEVLPLDILFYPLFRKCGLKLRNRIIWHFGHGLHASRRFSGRYETILWFTKTDKYFFNLDKIRVPSKYPGKTYYKGPKNGEPSGNPLGKNPSDVWRFVAKDWDLQLWDIPNVKANHPEKTIHPCQFPVELVQRCILALTDSRDWILDPYMGVGSSLLAGLLHNRRVVGCDKEPLYVDVAKGRIRSLLLGQLKLRQLGTPIHVPTGQEKVARIPLDWLVAKD